MEQLLDQYLHYLIVEKGLSKNTIDAYSHGLTRFLDYLRTKKIQEMPNVSKFDIRAFLLGLKKQGLSTRSVVRNLVAIRTFFHFLIQEGILEANPIEELESPKMAKNITRNSEPEGGGAIIRTTEPPDPNRDKGSGDAGGALCYGDEGL